MRVLASQGKNRLYIGNLPKQLTHAEVEAILKPLTKGELARKLIVPSTCIKLHSYFPIMCLDTESERVFLLQLSVNIDLIFSVDVDPTETQ